MERPGVDKSWIVGTEHRQLNIYEPELRSPKSMKNMMVDHIKRRYFIIDADVAVSSLLSLSILNAKMHCLHSRTFQGF